MSKGARKHPPLTAVHTNQPLMPPACTGMPTALRFVPGIVGIVLEVVAREVLQVIQKVEFVAAKVGARARVGAGARVCACAGNLGGTGFAVLPMLLLHSPRHQVFYSFMLPACRSAQARPALPARCARPLKMCAALEASRSMWQSWTSSRCG